LTPATISDAIFQSRANLEKHVAFSMTFTSKSILQFPYISMTIMTLIVVPQIRTHISFLYVLPALFSAGCWNSVPGRREVMTISH